MGEMRTMHALVEGTGDVAKSLLAIGIEQNDFHVLAVHFDLTFLAGLAARGGGRVLQECVIYESKHHARLAHTGISHNEHLERHVALCHCDCKEMKSI